MRNDVAASKTANIVVVGVFVIFRKRWDVQPADAVVAQYFESLRFEFWCVVDDELFREAICNDGVNGFWARRKGLRGGSVITRN